MGYKEELARQLNEEFEAEEKRLGVLVKIKNLMKFYNENQIPINRVSLLTQGGHPADPAELILYNQFQEQYVDLEAFAQTYPNVPPMITQLFKENDGVGFALGIKQMYPDLDEITDEANFITSGRVQYEVRVPGGATTSGDISFVMTNKGIDKEVIRQTNQGVETTVTILWAWDSYQITDVVRERAGGEPVYYFNYVYNGDVFAGKTIEQMRDAMAPTACRAIGVAKTVFGGLVMEYVKKYIPVIHEFEGKCGFTMDGWRLPDKHHLRFLPGVQDQVKAEISKMARMVVHDHEAKEMMKALYEAVSLKHKDILFAWGMAAPYFHALIGYTNIMPVLSLGSAIGNTGKTPAAEIITTLWWNNLPHGYLSADQFNSEARAQQYLSASTFPVCVDECADLRDNLTQLIKSHVTGEQDYTRLRQDSSVAFNRTLLAPVVLTWNKRPVLMDDFNFLLRTIHVPVDETPTKDDVDRFLKARTIIPRGYLGRYVYKMTEDWDGDYVTQRLEGTPWLDVEGRPRSRWIGRLLNFGADLFKELFDITLDLAHVPALIAQTMAMHTDNEAALMVFQFVDGRDDKLVTIWDPESKCNLQEPRFQPQRKWIQTPTRRVSNRVNNGYVYTTDNLNDLRRRANRPDLTMETAVEGLKLIYTHATLKTVRLDGKNGRHIFVPYEDVFPFGEDFNENDGPVEPMVEAADSPSGRTIVDECMVGSNLDGVALEVYNLVCELHDANMSRPVDIDSIKARSVFAGISDITAVTIVSGLCEAGYLQPSGDGYFPKKIKGRANQE